VPQICPCCARRADATARYCSDCYCVFPTGRKDNAPRKAQRNWGWVAILLLIIGGLWAVGDGDTAELAPTTRSEAAGPDVWRSAPGRKPADRDPVTRPAPEASSTAQNGGDTAAGEPNAQSPDERAPAKAGGNPGGAEAPCLQRPRCVATVRFASGEAASYVLKRSPASILLIATNERAARLLEKNNRASLEIAAAGKGARMVSLKKVIGAQWTT
jgi:hypothetical protein